MSWFFLVSLVFFIAGGCTQRAAPDISKMTPAQLAERGKAIYQLNCISCHNPDPTKDGVVGPAISGSARGLIEMRVLRAGYPAGYKSKRNTQLMPPLPHLEKEIPALEAFLR